MTEFSDLDGWSLPRLGQLVRRQEGFPTAYNIGENMLIWHRTCSIPPH